MISSRIFLFSLLVIGCVVICLSAMPQRMKRAPGPDKKDNPGDSGISEGTGSSNWGKILWYLKKKKSEGDQMSKYGDKSRKENVEMQRKVEQSQQETMTETLNSANDELSRTNDEYEDDTVPV